jgi:hypothetical protein
VAIARTLVLQPDLLLMDEPFSSLDAPTRLGLRELTLALWREQQFTFVVVTHAIEEAFTSGSTSWYSGSRRTARQKCSPTRALAWPTLRESDDYRALMRELRERISAGGQVREKSAGAAMNRRDLLLAWLCCCCSGRHAGNGAQPANITFAGAGRRALVREIGRGRSAAALPGFAVARAGQPGAVHRAGGAGRAGAGPVAGAEPHLLALLST